MSASAHTPRVRRHDIHLAVCLCVLGALTLIPFFILLGGNFFSAEAELVRGGMRAVEIVVSTPAAGYTAALFFWGVTTLLVGGMWAHLLLRNSPRVHQLFFAFAFGFTFLALNIIFGSIAAWLGIISFAEFSERALAMFSTNTDTSYAILHALTLLFAGILLLIAREVVRTARKGGNAYDPENL